MSLTQGQTFLWAEALEREQNAFENVQSTFQVLANLGRLTLGSLIAADTLLLAHVQYATPGMLDALSYFLLFAGTEQAAVI